MAFTRIFFSKKTFICLSALVLLSLILTQFPLIGTLGFEFSAVMSFVLAFVSVFLSAEFVTIDVDKKFAGRRRLSDVVLSILGLNFALALFPFTVGLSSSLIKDGCYIKEGAIFYMLIPLTAVFFSTTLGLLTGTVFGKRGFFIGALVLLATVFLSVWELYLGPEIFVYNTVFGFFPGPIYDEVIPITRTLIIHRLIVVCWGTLLLLVLRFVHGLGYGRISAGYFLAVLFVLLILMVSIVKKEKIGISYTREYITRNFLTESIRTENFVIYYSPDTTEAENIKLIAEDHEWRYHQLSNLLNVTSEKKISSYIYPDTRTRKMLIGSGGTTLANPIHGEIHLVYDNFPHPLLKHELTHVMSSKFGTRFLNVSPEPGLIEGLAVAAEWSSDLFGKHRWAKWINESGTAPEINEILGYGFWYVSGPKAYTLMGSFCRFLIDSYGIGKFKKLYGTGDFSVYEKNLDELVSEWKSFLKGITLSESEAAMAEYKFSQPGIFGRKCPREVAFLREKGFEAYEQERYIEAGRYFKDALGFNRRDPVLISALAYSHYFGGDYAVLKDFLNERLDNKPDDILQEVDENVLLNLRANLLWQTGRQEEARYLFESVRYRPLPDDIKREIDIKISALKERGEVERKIREYFGTRDDLTRLAALEEIIRDFPEYAPAYYLIGRIFYKRWEFERASDYFSRPPALELPTGELTNENLRLMSVSLFATGDYEKAQEGFKQILEIGGDEGIESYVADFIERASWQMGKKLN